MNRANPTKETSAQRLVDPIRVSPRSAARMLSLSYETVRSLINSGTFTVIAPKGRGPGKRVYLLPDEVRVYGTDGTDALRDMQKVAKKNKAVNRRK